MTRKFFIILVLAALILALGAGSALADKSGSCGTGVSYSFVSSTGTLTISGSGAMYGDYVQTSTPWYSIRNDIRSIVVQSGVTSIGQHAFMDCANLTSVTIAGSVTSIGADAFRNCTALPSIIVPGTVNSIDLYAFMGCTNLTNVVIQSGLSEIQQAVFKNCVSLKNVSLPDSVTRIGYSAFEGCRALTSVTIPAGLTSIGCYVFEDCSALTSMIIPETVEEILPSAFLRCTGLTALTILNPDCHIFPTAFAQCSVGLNIIGFTPSTAKDYCDKYSSEVSFTSLASFSGPCGDNAQYAFDRHTGVLSISGSGDMTDYYGASDIPWNAFRGDITSLVIESGVTGIGHRAFSYCSLLTDVTIPYSVSRIGYLAFADCAALTGVTILNPDCVIGDSDHDVFLNCTSGPVIHGWAGSTAQTFVGLASGVTFHSLGSLADPCGDNVQYAFHFPTGTLTISGSGAMADYSSSDSIPWNAFAEYILHAVIENGVTTVGASAFMGCTALTDVFIPDSVTWVKRNAFRDCSALTDVTIPFSVTTVDFWAFRFCSGLTIATVLNADCVIGDSDYDVFEGCAEGFSLRGYSASTAQAYAANVKNPCGFDLLAPAPGFFLPADLTDIESEAFSGITAQAVVIPKNIQSISGNPFAGSSVRYIYGFPGTAAETLAQSYLQFNFVPLTDGWYLRLSD